MRREGELLLDALRRRQAKAARPPVLVALDERGEALDTAELRPALCRLARSAPPRRSPS